MYVIVDKNTNFCYTNEETVGKKCSSNSSLWEYLVEISIFSKIATLMLLLTKYVLHCWHFLGNFTKSSVYSSESKGELNLVKFVPNHYPDTPSDVVYHPERYKWFFIVKCWGLLRRFLIFMYQWELFKTVRRTSEMGYAQHPRHLTSLIIGINYQTWATILKERTDFFVVKY